jgi:hypothetical protein
LKEHNSTATVVENILRICGAIGPISVCGLVQHAEIVVVGVAFTLEVDPAMVDIVLKRRTTELHASGVGAATLDGRAVYKARPFAIDSMLCGQTYREDVATCQGARHTSEKYCQG